MAIINLYLDDDDVYRPTPWGWTRCHSVNEAISMMREHEIEEMSLDHDLGNYAVDGGDGVKLVLWMAEHNVWPNTKPIIHSGNPVGRGNMEAYIERYGPYDY